MRLLYVTDVHGNRKAIERTLELAREEQVDGIIFGGDLTPKSVAVRLARYPDPEKEDLDTEEEIPLIGGQIIPLDMLRRQANEATYAESLQRIRTLNVRVGPEVLAESLERSGTLIIDQPNRFYELESMLAEQVLLGKLIAFFGDSKHPVKNFRIELSEDEELMVRDCAAEWMEEWEKTWDERMRTEFAKKCASALFLPQADFAKFAPSRHIERCVLGRIHAESMDQTFRAMKEVLRKRGDWVADSLSREIQDLQEDFLRARNYVHLIDETHIRVLVNYSSLIRVKYEAQVSERIREAQAKFLQEYFLPRIQKWRAENGNRPVYAMLANDDTVENVALLDSAEKAGTLLHLGGKIHDLGEGLKIAGYGCVQHLPEDVTYRAWEKNDADLKAELAELQLRCGIQEVVWVIHNPPYGILDLTEHGSVGSREVLEFIEKVQPSLALFGHIHEAPRLSGSHAAYVGRTLCLNPGGEHGDGLQSLIIDTVTRVAERRCS